MKVKRDLSTKPYYRCFLCPQFRNTCGGRPTRDYDLRTWCELIRDVIEYFDINRSYVADKAEVSLKTVERIVAINVDNDIMRATARRIEQVVLGPVGDYTCHLDRDNSTAPEIINKLQSEIEYWRKENDRKAKIIDKYLA